MTRRPKLSLSPDNKGEKKQAPGFSSMASPHKPGTVPGAKTPSVENRGNPSPANGTDKITQPSNDWNAGKVMKVFLVAAATALSLYLLKKRFI